MSLHPSLKIDKAGSAQRTVLTRIERIKEMMKKGLWSDASSVTALPKTKIVRIKAKKKTAADATAAAPGAEGAAAAPAAAGKPAAAAAKPAAAPAKK
jgi:small basic protein (TIGR04137 family)